MFSSPDMNFLMPSFCCVASSNMDNLPSLSDALCNLATCKCSKMCLKIKTNVKKILNHFLRSTKNHRFSKNLTELDASRLWWPNNFVSCLYRPSGRPAVPVTLPHNRSDCDEWRPLWWTLVRVNCDATRSDDSHRSSSLVLCVLECKYRMWLSLDVCVLARPDCVLSTHGKTFKN